MSTNKVYAAINAVQAELAKAGIAKADENKFDNYKFRGIDAIYNHLSPLLAKHKLCILPRMLARQCDERTSQKGGALFYVTVEAEFDFVSVEDGSKHIVRTFGEAMDRGDKATNKAMSAAYKYAAFQAFAIPTEGDNDADAHSHEVAARPASAKSVAQDAWDNTPAEVQQRLVEIADIAKEHLEQGSDVEAVTYIKDRGLDADEYAALWNRFDSKQRTRLKAASKQLETA